MEWRNKRLKCEINVKESVRDAVFLQNEAMFAVIMPCFQLSRLLKIITKK
jgi:hypothetical protein